MAERALELAHTHLKEPMAGMGMHADACTELAKALGRVFARHLWGAEHAALGGASSRAPMCIAMVRFG